MITEREVYTAAQIREALGISQWEFEKCVNVGLMPSHHYRPEMRGRHSRTRFWNGSEIIPIVDEIIKVAKRVRFERARDWSPLPLPAHSVREFPGHISLQAIETKPGVYFLIKDEMTVYIGQSQNPSSRVYSHTYDFDEAIIIHCDPEDLNQLEGALIRRYRPKHNGTVRTKRRRLHAPGNEDLDDEVLAKYKWIHVPEGAYKP